LNHSLDRQDPSADATLTLTRTALNKVILQESTFDEEIKNGQVQVDGSLAKVHELISMLDTFEFWFNIVTP
jgi:alkyl sulfatase BDS1-like metallo-beta-lactamase superfamily hydrolase